MPPTTRRPHSARTRIARFGRLSLLAALAAAPLCGFAAEPPSAAPALPPGIAGTWCPAGSCEARPAGPWQAASFATALAAVVLLARRRQAREMVTQRK